MTTNTEITSPRSSRRRFLQDAAWLTGAAALALHGQATEAASSNVATSVVPLSLGFWDGTRLIAADSLRSGNARDLANGARLTILGAPTGAPVISGVDVFYRVAVKGVAQWLPHFAWTRAPLSTAQAVVTTPTLAGGVLLSVHHQGIETFLPLTLGNAPGQAKLCAGTYVLAAGSPAWALYFLQPGAGPLDPGTVMRRSLSGPVPAGGEYLTITVAPA